MQQGHRDLSVTLTADEANAVVEAISLALTTEGDLLGHSGSDSPGDLFRLGGRAARIRTYADLGDALDWHKYWGRGPVDPPDVTAPEAAWIDLLGELQKRADEMRICDVDPRDLYEFDAAARTVARAFADAAAVAA